MLFLYISNIYIIIFQVIIYVTKFFHFDFCKSKINIIFMNLQHYNNLKQFFNYFENCSIINMIINQINKRNILYCY